MDEYINHLNEKSKYVKECDIKKSTAKSNKTQNGEQMIAGR